jgi:CRP/FNR family transcriptional regulator, cyclic AMP receptor protein
MALKLVPTRPSKQTLAGIPLFQDLPHDVVRDLSQHCKWHCYRAHETIIEFQDHDRRVFFVVQGRARVVYYSSCGQEVIFRFLSDGDMFGELTAIDGQSRSATIIADTDAVMASMTDTQFNRIVRDYEVVGAAVLQRLAALVRALSERIVEFSTLPVRSRIHIELLRLAGRTCSDRNAASIFPLPTHGDIASRVSTHREAVSRELSELARAGIIERRGSTLIIHDVTALVNMVHDASGGPVSGFLWPVWR